MRVQSWILGSMLVLVSTLIDALPASQTKTIHWKPKMRLEEVKAKESMNFEKLRVFLKPSIVLESQKLFENAPSIAAFENEYSENGLGSTFYAQGLLDANEKIYTIFKPGKAYRHPLSKEILGFEALAIGKAKLKSFGTLSELEIIEATESVDKQARLLPLFTSELPEQLSIKPATTLKNDGYILSTRESLHHIGEKQVVLISLGARDGIEVGHVLNIFQAGKTIIDPTHKGWQKKHITLPDKKIGKLYVYQCFEKMSVALIVESNQMIHLMDKIKSDPLALEN